MAVKTITITEEAYHRLASKRQRDNESFSEVINRITGRASLREFAGIWSKEEADQFERGIEKIRKLREKGNKERLEMIKKGLP